MRVSITTAAAIAALLLASPTAAQQDGPRPEVVAATAELMDRLTVLMTDLGADASDLPRDQLVRAIEAALPLRAEDDGTSWASGMQFNFTTTVAEGDLEPDPDGGVILTDARACLPADAVGEVVHFERITRDGLRGHRCVILLNGTSDGVWLLRSETFGEGPGRRFRAHYALGVTTGQNTDLSRRMIEERLDANIRLSGAMALEGLDLFLLKPRDGGPVSQTEADGRLAQLGAQLDQLADTGEAR